MLTTSPAATPDAPHPSSAALVLIAVVPAPRPGRSVRGTAFCPRYKRLLHRWVPVMPPTREAELRCPDCGTTLPDSDMVALLRHDRPSATG